MSKPRRHPLTHAVPPEELLDSLALMASPVLGIEPADMPAWFMSMRQLAADSGEGRLPEGRVESLPVNKLVGAWTKIAQSCWPNFPEQERTDEQHPLLRA